MANHIKTKELAEHLQKLVRDDLKETMSLKFVHIGTLEHYPQDDLASDCPIVFIRPLAIDSEEDDLHANFKNIYLFRFVYVYKFAEGDDPTLKKMEYVDYLLELLFEKESLPGYSNAEVQIELTNPNLIEYEPYEETIFLTGINARLTAVAVNFLIQVVWT